MSLNVRYSNFHELQVRFVSWFSGTRLFDRKWCRTWTAVWNRNWSKVLNIVLREHTIWARSKKWFKYCVYNIFCVCEESQIPKTQIRSLLVIVHSRDVHLHLHHLHHQHPRFRRWSRWSQPHLRQGTCSNHGFGQRITTYIKTSAVRIVSTSTEIHHHHHHHHGPGLVATPPIRCSATVLSLVCDEAVVFTLDQTRSIFSERCRTSTSKRLNVGVAAKREWQRMLNDE